MGLRKVRFTSFMLITAMLLPNTAFAEKTNALLDKNLKLALCLDGKVAVFEGKDSVLKNTPYMSGENYMIPAEYVLECLGYEADEYSVTEKSDVIKLKDKEYKMSATAQITGGEYFVPSDVISLAGREYKITPSGILSVCDGGEFTDEADFKKLQGIYVSEQGNNASDGTPSHPVADIDKAKEIAVKYMQEFGDEYKVRIFVKSGTYRQKRSVSFEEGVFKSDYYKGLSIEGFDSENQPEITGSIKLNTADFVPVTDAKTLAKLHKNGRGKVATIDLSKYGIKELNQIPNVFYYLYLNDVEQTNARWPNEGEATVFSVPQTNSFTFSETDPLNWTEAKNAYVYGHFSTAGWEWHDGIIQSVDTKTKTINISSIGSGSMSTSATGTTWYASNLLEELDSPGEWFVDTENLKLYYYPPYGIKDQKLEMTYFTDTLFTFSEAVNVTIKDINFSKCYRALNFSGVSRNITIESCDFSHGQAETMVNFGDTCGYGINIIENDVYNLFGRFVYFRAGNVKTLKHGSSLVKNNHLTQVAQYYRAVGGMGGGYQLENHGCVGVECVNNVVQDIPGGAALGWGGTQCSVNYNEVINAGKSMSDYGAIYVGRSASYYDMEVAHNYLHDFTDTNNYNALYNDDAFCGAYWHHNVCVNMYQPCNQAPGFDTRYMYNVAVNCARSGTIGSRKSFGNQIYYGGLLWTQTKQLLDGNTAVYKKSYPKLFEWLERDKTYFAVCYDSLFYGNIGVGSKAFNNFAELSQYGAKTAVINGEEISVAGLNGTIEGNPYYDYSDDIFVDTKNQNYSINPQSEVAKKTPQLLEIDVTKAGLTEDALYIFDKPEKGSHLKYPINGQKGLNSSEITFSWDPVKGASFYEITIATDPKLENVIYSQEIRENGNFNQITVDNFTNNTVYYWKVTAKGIARQNMFEIDSIGGPYAFKTALRDELSKDNLRLAITAFEEFCQNDLRNKDYEFDSDFIKSAETKLEAVKLTYKNAVSQAELDKAEEEIYNIIKKSPFYMKLHFENINGVYDENASWQTGGKISVNDGVLTFSSAEGVRADALTKIKNKNSVLCFKMKLENLGTSASDYQGFDIKLNDKGNGYLVVFKHDIIEWQRINRTLTEIPNDFIEAGKWYDVQAGGINTPNGVLQFFRVNGRLIYAELDQTANQTRDEGLFKIRKNGLGNIQIKDMEQLPQDGIIINDIINAFKNPQSDKHLQTLFIGSSDAMEMSSFTLFNRVAKSEIAEIMYPMVSGSEINVSADNIADYKSLIEQACIIAGYNNGLSELIFKNKIDFMYSDILGIDSIDTNGVTIYKHYQTMSDKFKASANELMTGGGCKTLQELKDRIVQGMFTGTVNACYVGFAGQSGYLSNLLTKENADCVGIDISTYLALSEEDKLKANDIIGNSKGNCTERTLEELQADIKSAAQSVK